MSKWTVTIEEDPETGELVLPFSDEMLTAVGWEIGDTITWTVNEDGSCVLTKNEEHSKYYFDTERNK